ncbi:UDP-galactopyranose mutase [Flavobacterium foetidum]|uniref:UDP-galactopyranose mutase n=1 Tax=Flavobacterium foetidum TaxID=2026681 RepID=UPI001074E841|nr:UDP-galactopyranose mutase [Flavobacterium foetidum]KAF2510540.1 UDP-galactopyranose mutase [Flavobacterium foetidum]
MKHIDILIIGAGISGAVLAERYATIGKKVLVIEKRNHIGGNCYDYIDENGILVSKYGAHLFHTNDEAVWRYVNRFADWYTYEHKEVARINNHTVPFPININSINKLFDLDLKDETDMKIWLSQNRTPIVNPSNGEEAILNRTGTVLYANIFKDYIKKQWNKNPAELDAGLLDMIPFKTNFDDRYFSEQCQTLPDGGYTQLFENMLDHPNIEVLLDTDFFDVKDQYKNYEKMFYTGPIDRYFDFKHSLTDTLEYRSLKFVNETIEAPYFQENAVVNYPGTDVDFTRITEYKYFGNQKSDKTTIVKEFTVQEGEPYYPVPTAKNNEIYSRYKEDAAQLTDVHFVGRLANYKYFSMDQAFKNALDLFEELENKTLLQTAV